MNAKISQNEAFMVVCENSNGCLGIVAISIKANRITFFGVTHICDYVEAGRKLLSHALSLLNTNADISHNIIKSKAKHIQAEYDLFKNHGFLYSSDDLEHDVPVSVMIRAPQPNSNL